jgi:D-alanyl-lipoteichoic acid acyltransferase DltB (MBOAT superfamily)
MAIGIALLLGFHFPMNFNAPYRAESISDFWRRWHISLSTWIRDYIYISLGGNRRGKLRTYATLLLTMLLGRLWHGASLNFVAWGGMHGVALAVHKWSRHQLFHHERYYQSAGWRRIGAMLLTFHFVAFAWVFFRHQSFDNAWAMLGRITGHFHPELFVPVLSGYRSVFIMMALGYLSHFLPDSLQETLISVLRRGGILLCAAVMAVAIYIVIQFKSSTIQPFIYFQF